MLLQALSDLTPNAIGRTHDRMPCRRRFQIESACNPRHTVIAVKLLGQTIRHILLGRQDFRRIGRRTILGQNRMDDRTVEPCPAQTLQPLAAQLRQQRYRHETVAPFGANFPHVENRISAAGKLCGDGFRHLPGIFRRFERPVTRNLGYNPLAIGKTHRYSLRRYRRVGTHGNHAPRTAAVERQRKAAVEIAEHLRPGDDALHPVGHDPISGDLIDIGTRQPVPGPETDAVPGRQVVRPGQREVPAINPGYSAHELADGLGRIERRDSRPATVEEILRFAPREALRRIRLKVRPALPHGRAAESRPRRERPIDPLAVMAHDIFNISDILQASFDLERGNPRIDQLAYTVRQIQIPHRQQMPPLDDRTPGLVHQIVGQAAGLAASAPVTAAFAHRTRQETAAAVPHADRPVDETLQIAPAGGTDRPDLVERQGPLQNHAGKAAALQKKRLLRRTCGRLRRSVQLDRQIHPPQRHVLHDQGVHPGGDQLPGLPLGFGQLAVIEQRIERSMHPYTVLMGILYRSGDLLRRIARRVARTEAGASDIEGVGAVIDRSDGRLQIFGGSE